MVADYIKQRIWGLQRSLFFPSFFSCRERPLLAEKSIERREHHFKREFALFQTSMILFSSIEFVCCWRNFLRLNPKEPYLSLEKEKEKFLRCAHLLRKAGAWDLEVSCRSRATTAKKRAKKRGACAQLLFCWYKPIAFFPFSLPSPVSLRSLYVFFLSR